MILNAHAVEKDEKNEIEETVYIINEEVLVGDKEILTKPKSKFEAVFDKAIAKNKKEQKKVIEEDENTKNENDFPLIKIEGQEYGDDVPYNEREHPYMSLLVDFINRIPKKQKQEIVALYHEYLKVKEEVKEGIQKYLKEVKPEQEKELRRKIKKFTNPEQAEVEEKLISDYNENIAASSRFMSCMSNVTDGIMVAMAEITPKRLFYTASRLYNINLDVLSHENVSKLEKYYLLPNVEGYFYNKTNAFVMYRAKDISKPVKLNVRLNYEACSLTNDKDCREYHDIFPLTVEPLNQGKKSFIVSECLNLKDLLKKIPDPEYSSIKLLNQDYDDKEKVALFSFLISDGPKSPSLSYYDESKERNIFGSSLISGDKVFIRIPFLNEGKDTKFEIRDGDKALKFSVDKLNENDDTWNTILYFVRAIERGVVLNFITPALLLIVAFLTSFSGFGEGRIERVREKTKEVLIGILLVFVLFGITFVVLSSIRPLLKFGFQFKYPLVNVAVIAFATYFSFKTKNKFFLKTILLVPLFIIFPFIRMEECFNYFYDLGPIYVLILFLCIGFGFALPYLMFLIFPEYVIAMTPIDGTVYSFKNIRWSPLIIGGIWYIFVSISVISGLNKIGGESFSIERFEQLSNNKEMVYVSMSANEALGSLFSRFVVLTNLDSKKNKMTVLRADYHNPEVSKYLKKIGIDTPDKSLFTGNRMPGGLIVSGIIIAGELEDYLGMVR